MSINGMFEKYGDKYILNHANGEKYVRWGAIERSLDVLVELEAKNGELENRLELAEGEWKTYATVSKSLSKRLKIAVEALETLKSWSEDDGFEFGKAMTRNLAIEALEKIKAK